MTIQFWSNDFTILFNKNYLFDLWPTSKMCYEQKINSISRLIILLTILGYILTMSTKIIIVGVLTLIIIYILYSTRNQKLTKQMLESFDVNIQDNPMSIVENNNQSSSIINPVTLDSVLRTEFKEGNKKNPFSNVLLTQINDDPNRKAAPPSFNVSVDEDIIKNTKKSIQMMNPGIKNTNKQLFGDLWQNFQLDNCLRVFNSCPNTRVANDQGAYGRFLYGFMPSGKESTPEGAMARVQDNYRYTLY